MLKRVKFGYNDRLVVTKYKVSLYQDHSYFPFETYGDSFDKEIA